MIAALTLQPTWILIQAAFLLLGSTSLWLGARFIAKLPKATFLRSIFAYLLIVILTLAIFFLSQFSFLHLVSDPNLAQIPSLHIQIASYMVGLIDILLILIFSWLIIKFFFKASLFETILAWLPTLAMIPIAVFISLILFPLLAPRQPDIIVSYETTRALAPLKPDGTVDYIAVMNRDYSQAVTAENNAAILLLQALGPEALDDEYRDALLRALGMSDLPEQGNYLTTFADYAFEHLPADETQDADNAYAPSFPAPSIMPPFPMPPGPPMAYNSSFPTAVENALKDLEKARSRPWTSDEFPLIAQWLKANQKPLDHAAAASRRSRYYVPFLPSQESPGLFGLGESPSLCYAHSPNAIPIWLNELLAARAMLNLGAGNIQAAQTDLLTLHRLARLRGERPDIEDRLSAYGLDRVACTADYALAASKSLNARQAREYLASLRALPPISSLWEIFDTQDRYQILETITAYHQDLSTGEESYLDYEPMDYLTPIPQLPIDVNPTLQLMNQWFDLSLQLVRADIPPEERRRSQAALNDLNELADRFDHRGPAFSCKTILSTTLYGIILGPKAACQRLTYVTKHVLARAHTPSLDAIIETKKAVMRFHLNQICFALTAHRFDHDRYPDNLQALCPQYLPRILNSPFTGDPLDYHLEGNGYILFFTGHSADSWDDILIDTSGQTTE